MDDCIFCKIAKGEIATKFILETDHVVVFYDIHPLAPTHILIVPKEHVISVLDIKSTHAELLLGMIVIAQKLIKDYNLETGYRVMFNGGRYQHVFHLHMHLLGGEEG
jgi:histidine triad (HIT) family protein